jgi:hypothetical protein
MIDIRLTLDNSGKVRAHFDIDEPSQATFQACHNLGSPAEARAKMSDGIAALMKMVSLYYGCGDQFEMVSVNFNGETNVPT